MEKLKAIVSILAIFLLAGCTEKADVLSPTPHHYPMGDLALRLTQAEDSSLVLELQNTSGEPITNAFPESRFEGKFTFIQEGCVPIVAYSKTYFQMMTSALWSNPEITLQSRKTLTYTVPLNELVPFPPGEPVTSGSILLFATMDGFDVSSNVIEVQHREKIKWYAFQEGFRLPMPTVDTNQSIQTPP